MNEYFLVQAKDDNGRIYISRSKPEDSDTQELLFSWDEEKTPLLNLVTYLILGQLTTKEDIENELELSGISDKDYTTVVRKIINNISFDNMQKKLYVKSLYDIRMISSQTKTKLLIALSRLIQSQVRFVRSFDYTTIDYNKVKANLYRARTVYLSSTENK